MFVLLRRANSSVFSRSNCRCLSFRLWKQIENFTSADKPNNGGKYTYVSHSRKKKKHPAVTILSFHIIVSKSPTMHRPYQHTRLFSNYCQFTALLSFISLSFTFKPLRPPRSLSKVIYTYRNITTLFYYLVTCKYKCIWYQYVVHHPMFCLSLSNFCVKFQFSTRNSLTNGVLLSSPLFYSEFNKRTTEQTKIWTRWWSRADG